MLAVRLSFAMSVKEMSQWKKSKTLVTRHRLWEHGLHEDSAFNERQNYFLVAESMLLVAYSVMKERT